MPEKQGNPADYLGPLLRTLAESLDVREIFARISAAARHIVPHDFLMFGVLTEDNQKVRLTALSGDLPDIPPVMAVPAALRSAIEDGEFVLSDIKMRGGDGGFTGLLKVAGKEEERVIEVEMQALYREIVRVRGMRSLMRVAVRLRGGVLGGLLFWSTDPNAYTPDDLPRASHVADCVALAVAHQRLAEEEQRSAEARERAARLEIRVRRLTEELEEQGRHRVLGRSKQWQDVLSQATKVAATEATVFLSGESGTGKEVIARLIHRASPRAEGPFVALNCAALPEQLLESELFGHEKGAFTGALTARAGKIEQAAAGVLFLDEVGEMSPAVQAKFLRVIQEREYQRVGGTRTLKADIRVLAATNRNLKAAIAQGTFREDLYYRLAVFDIMLPPLRERPEDILTLVAAFLEEIGRSVGRPAAGLSQDARDKLVKYPWPGNVRELRNVVERAVILCDGGRITSEHLPVEIASAARPAAVASVALSAATGAATLDDTEREMILQALARAGNNKSKAARFLGLTRAQLRSRIEKYRIDTET